MNLREQFEKETGIDALIHHRYDIENLEEAFDEEYVEWLEQRNKEHYKLLKDCIDIIEWYNKHFPQHGISEPLEKIKEQLKKSGEL